ncbi:TPA: hypothetical protein DCQ22_04800 [Candidatus Nomurabacteria bacterium]|nr:hypothetical protein [Candidatus Nomurabacteria bacterium]
MNNESIESAIVNLEKRVQILENAILVYDMSKNEPLEEKKVLSIKEFLLSKNIENDVQRTLAIAYFLEKYENISPFNVADLEDGYRKSKNKTPLNINDKVNINVKNNHIMVDKGKKDARKAWVLTAPGEIFVENNFK